MCHALPWVGWLLVWKGIVPDFVDSLFAYHMSDKVALARKYIQCSCLGFRVYVLHVGGVKRFGKRCEGCDVSI